MPLSIPAGAPTLFVRRSAYEHSGLSRAALDERLGLTDNEFRVEGEVIAIGPVFDSDAFVALVADLEGIGLTYYEDFFELSGGWPEWLTVLVSAPPTRAGRSKPSQPHS
jgi:hypothetical protein